MDFSSSQRAVRSLLRRTPKLPEATLHVAKELNEQQESSKSTTNASLPTVQAPELILKLFHAQNEGRWEPLAVGLLLTAEYLDFLSRSNDLKDEDGGDVVYVDGPRKPLLKSTLLENETNGKSLNASPSPSHLPDEWIHAAATTFCKFVLCDLCRQNLEHDEPRVRTLVARVIGSHARLACTTGHPSFLQQRNEVWSYIGSSLRTQAAMFDEDRELPSPDFQAPALDDTTGWRSLETNILALASSIGGSASHYNLSINTSTSVSDQSENISDGMEYLVILENCASKHINRHVRAAALQCLEQMIHHSNNIILQETFVDCLIRVLKICLADNWSQVRMAASVLHRVFILKMFDCEGGTEVVSRKVFPALLPAMCLNRFYLAQGVQLYSKETWKLIFTPSSSPSSSSEDNLNAAMEVCNNASRVCRFYVKMADADNHVVREAACQAIAELADRLGSNPNYKSYLEPYVPMLLQSLCMCFHDESWPVRDEACLACGTFVKAYPRACLNDLPMLFERWTDHLCDQIWSVREDAAVALGDALRAYVYDRSLVFDPLMSVIESNIPLAKDQPAMTREEYIARQNDAALHTDSQLYSCGSLAPKLKKRSHGGCSDCKVNRDRMPWEATDGCIYMLRELSSFYAYVRNNDMDDDKLKNAMTYVNDELIVTLMEKLLDACRVKHFPQSDDLRATLFKQLPTIARNIGKTTFKRKYLNLFLELLMDNVRSNNVVSASCKFAASQCCEQLANFVGVSIFRGRCEEIGANWELSSSGHRSGGVVLGGVPY